MSKYSERDVVIGFRVRQIRENMNLSQHEFADLLQISRSFVGNIERGQGVSSTAFLLLSDYAKASIDWVITGHGSMFRPLNVPYIEASVVKDDVPRLQYDAPKLPPPMSKPVSHMETHELHDLGQQLQSAIDDLERRYNAVDRREQALDERERFLDEIIERYAAKLGDKGG